MRIAQLYKSMIFCLLFLVATNLFAASSDDIHFLTLADIHFDPFASCTQTRGRCLMILRLRQADASEWNAILANSEYIKPQYRHDTNYFLLKSALSAAQTVAQKNQIAFVIILGDFLGHDYRKKYIKYANDTSITGYQAFVKKTLAFLTEQIANTFQNIDVYPVIGNNDTYQKDYEMETNGLFFTDSSHLWSSFIKTKQNRSNMQREFPKDGYYTATLKQADDLKLIVLNSVLFSYKAKGKEINNAAIQELNWLHDQLKLAQQKNQKVLIAMHIPEGIDVYATLQFRLFRLIKLWHSTYASKFEEMLKEFAPQIVGILEGHLHSDWFQLLTIDIENKIPVSGTASISPIYGNNPGFKLYSYSLKTKKLDAFQTYFYEINRETSWHVEYDFDHAYEAHCKRCLVENELNHVTLLNQLKTASKVVQPPINQWNPYYRCVLQGDSHQDKECLK